MKTKYTITELCEVLFNYLQEKYPNRCNAIVFDTKKQIIKVILNEKPVMKLLGNWGKKVDVYRT